MARTLLSLLYPQVLIMMSDRIRIVPFRFHGIYALGCIFFLLNIVLFIFDVFMIGMRFYLYPSTFKASFLHPTESLFIPAAVIGFGTILMNITQYGVGEKTGYWLKETMTMMYWIYCGLAVVFSFIIYLIMYLISFSLPSSFKAPPFSQFLGGRRKHSQSRE